MEQAFDSLRRVLTSIVEFNLWISEPNNQNFIFQVHDVSGAGIYKSIVNFFEMHEVPYKSNMVRFATDSASVMFGDNNSVFSLFKKDTLHLFIMKRVCYSLALAVSYTSKVLPESLQTLLTDIHRYLKYRRKR